jgi:hypothetical protein
MKMPEPPKRKIGLVSCSGEEMAEGMVTRLATLKVLEALRPDTTVTICLPLFLAGGEGDRAFARFYPTIAIDGCEKRCAARGTEMYSSKTAASIVVNEICPAAPGELGTARHLSAAGVKAVDEVAAEIAGEVDRLMGIPWNRTRGQAVAESPVTNEKSGATCSCGSGVPVRILEIDGSEIEVLALPPILEMFRAAGKPVNDGTAAEMFETVRLYNQVPEGAEVAWKLALGRDYASYMAEGK